MFLPRKFFSAVLMLSLSPILPTLYSAHVYASPEEYTHGVLAEYIDSVYCSTCRAELPTISSLYKELRGGYIPVAYHALDEWVTNASLQMMVKFTVVQTPYHVFDGGYVQGGGFISKQWIDKAGARPAHKIELAVKKTVSASNLTYYGSVRELDGQPLEGLLRIFIVENKINAQNLEWNFVFRDFGIEQSVNISPNGYTRFSGSWKPRTEYKIENLMVIASVWKRDATGRLLSIQATNDEYSGTPITDTTPDGKPPTTTSTPPPTITPTPSPTDTQTPPPTSDDAGQRGASLTYLYVMVAIIAIVGVGLIHRRHKTRKITSTINAASVADQRCLSHFGDHTLILS